MSDSAPGFNSQVFSSAEEELMAFDQALRDRLGLTQAQIEEDDDGPLITLAQIAHLGGLAPGSPGAARQRSLRGQSRVPFPEPDAEWLSRMPDKPLFRAYDILDYFVRTGNWPLGQAARPAMRHPRQAPKAPPAAPEDKINFTQLKAEHPRLASQIARKGLQDGARRSVSQWRWRARWFNGGTKPEPQK